MAKKKEERLFVVTIEQNPRSYACAHPRTVGPWTRDKSKAWLFTKQAANAWVNERADGSPIRRDWYTIRPPRPVKR